MKYWPDKIIPLLILLLSYNLITFANAINYKIINSDNNLINQDFYYFNLAAFKADVSIYNHQFNDILDISHSPCAGIDSTLLVAGKIIDSETKEPISYASVYLQGLPIGTVSNSNGEFTFIVPYKFENGTVVISMVGYMDFKISVKEWKESKLINLYEATFQLNEIIVSTSLSAQQIMAKAADHIKDNYPVHPYALKGFFRSIQKEDGKYINLVEAAISLYDSGYLIGDIPEEARLDEIRSNIQGKEIAHDRENKLHVLLVNNPVKYRNAARKLFVDKSLSYNMDSIVYVNNRQVYLISLSKTPLRYYTFYVDAITYAVLKIEVVDDYTVSDQHPPYVWREKDNIQVRSLYYKVVLDFRNYQNRMFLNYISRLHVLQDFNNIKKTEVKRTEQFTELLINDIQLDNVKRIPKHDQMDNKSLNKQIKVYNKDFWMKYNVIQLLPVESVAIKQFEKEESLEAQFKNFKLPKRSK
jgi:hypothetical protein